MSRHDQHPSGDNPQQDRRQKNLRTAWLLGLFVLLVALSAIPFWQGLHRIALGGG